MKKLICFGIGLIFVFSSTCSIDLSDAGNFWHYTSSSRLTDPKEFKYMLENLPDDIVAICEIAKQQTVHHNLLAYFGVPYDKWDEMNRIWPSGTPIPGMADLLAGLKEVEPNNIYDKRQLEQRLVAACMLESTFLTGLLRYKGIPARIRAGYFKDIMADPEHVISFWENVLRVRGSNRELLEANPEEWKQGVRAYTMQATIEPNKHIEHWICEYWDEKESTWRLLDANDTFLKAHSNMDVGFHLSKEHYEFAHEAWKKMRTSEDFNPARYAEEPQDGRSHIRSQMILDFYCLLNHDMAGFDDQTGKVMEFIKRQTYEEASLQELEELDMLAELMASNPSKKELVTFYQNSKTLKLETAEKDPYSFVFKTG